MGRRSRRVRAQTCLLSRWAMLDALNGVNTLLRGSVWRWCAEGNPRGTVSALFGFERLSVTTLANIIDFMLSS